MALANPQIQIIRRVTDSSEDWFVYVTTQFDQTDYMYDGFDDTPTVSSGVLSVKVNVTQSGVPLRMTKSISHQVPLTGINMSTITDVQVKVYNGTTEIASRTVPHQDEDETRTRPTSWTW